MRRVRLRVEEGGVPARRRGRRVAFAVGRPAPVEEVRLAPDAPDDERFKMISIWNPSTDMKEDDSGSWTMVSPDGVHFRPKSKGPVCASFPITPIPRAIEAKCR